MPNEAERTGHLIAGVIGLIAIAFVIVGALVVVDHINLAGTNQASVQQQEQKSPAVNPTAPSTAPNATPPNQVPSAKTN
jgi:predicted metalloprotease